MNSKQRSVIIVFFIVIALCAVLVIVGDKLGPSAGVGLVSAATEGFKVAVAALIGALSAILGGGGTNAK
ncbi:MULTISPECIES: hypothetical protein [Rhizobium]|uniref:hypothetical protein n=1 Tax=Rhizobium TaxID=379 RepID=UPI001C92098D|nr:hypothetical protein [Rhizobium laguerreae]MBY3355149.1 hypothetical protein [Rhizobium laguerreae]MBY3454266.1 hypothetical protein [Rhizobium laguerreae]MBY3461421.1 hypothetical protein [Rhizobium laguerreae]